MSDWKFRENSLDALRLLAAAQVVVLHTKDFMFPAAPESLFFQILRLFPGVPIFFFISGFLISKSYETAPALMDYAKNRMLRLYPALIICVFINILMVWSTGYFSLVGADWDQLLGLILAKSTILQFYNPSYMRQFGDGVLNGSLWTICVELQFYVLTPIVYAMFGKQRRISNRILVMLIILFLAANRLLYFWQPTFGEDVLWKLYRVSFAPWIYMFFVGLLVQRNFEVFSRYARKLPIAAVAGAYTAVAYVLCEYAGLQTGNSVSPILFFLLVVLVFRMAYFMPEQINGFMHGNDISYGIYIWHMPLINQMLYYGHKDQFVYALGAISATAIVAVLSWKLVEKPALGLKKYTLNIRLKQSA